MIMIDMQQIKSWKIPEGFINIDLVFAEYVTKNYSGTNKTILFLAAALASKAVRDGHSCCALEVVAGTLFPETDDTSAVQQAQLPSVFEFLQELTSPIAAPLVCCLPRDNAPASQPLVLNVKDKLLYLNRYYAYETLIAQEICERCKVEYPMEELPSGKLAALSKRFKQGSGTDTVPDYQQLAVFMAKQNHFTILTGGPGTGKTTVMTAMLVWYLEDHPDWSIHLCAPTGKAKQRMKESICKELPNLNCSEAVKQRLLQLPCSTLDSLLHPEMHTCRYRHNQDNPILADLIVVDEVSMISLSLLGNLLNALQKHTRLILIGDKDQLASVDAGSILANLYTTAKANQLPEPLNREFQKQTFWKLPTATQDSPLSGHIAELQINYRAKNAPEISGISHEIKMLSTHTPAPQEITNLTAKLLSMNSEEFSTTIPEPGKVPAKEIREFLFKKEIVLGKDKHYAPADMLTLAAKGDPESVETAFDILDSFKILCAVQRGPSGVQQVNSFICKTLKIKSLPAVGVPIMILENLPYLNLYNGNIGLILNHPEQPGTLYASFRTTDENGTVYRNFPLVDLPSYECIFAMTIHKSQGSGFQNVMILMPDKHSRLLTRELLYTAITRAEKRVRLVSSKAAIQTCLQQQTLRHSGLTARIRKGEIQK